MVAERQLLKCPEHSVKSAHLLNQTLTVINICKQLRHCHLLSATWDYFRVSVQTLQVTNSGKAFLILFKSLSLPQHVVSLASALSPKLSTCMHLFSHEFLYSACAVIIYFIHLFTHSVKVYVNVATIGNTLIHNHFTALSPGLLGEQVQ